MTEVLSEVLQGNNWKYRPLCSHSPMLLFITIPSTKTAAPTKIQISNGKSMNLS